MEEDKKMTGDKRDASGLIVLAHSSEEDWQALRDVDIEPVRRCDYMYPPFDNKDITEVFKDIERADKENSDSFRGDSNACAKNRKILQSRVEEICQKGLAVLKLEHLTLTQVSRGCWGDVYLAGLVAEEGERIAKTKNDVSDDAGNVKAPKPKGLQ